MRQYRTIAALSVLVFAGACNERETSAAGLPDDLARDLAAASATSSNLASAPGNYQRTRIVSDVERNKSSAPIKRTAMSMHHSAQPTAASEAVGEPPVESVPGQVATTVATTTDPATETPVLDKSSGDAAPPYGGPASSPSRSGREAIIIADRSNRGRMLGGVIGGLRAVLRGAHVDKRPPRTDGAHRRPASNGRPEGGEPRR